MTTIGYYGIILLIIDRARRLPELAAPTPEKLIAPDYSGLDSAAIYSLARTLRLPAISISLAYATFVAINAFRLLTQDPAASRQASDALPVGDPECQQVSYILPDPRCENPVLYPTPTAEQWERKVRNQQENKGKSPFLTTER